MEQPEQTTPKKLPTLRIARIASTWSQEALAQVADVTQATISNIEIGRHDPQPITRRRIEIALGTGIDWKETKRQALFLSNGVAK
ncbi:MAG: helix-turn-helix transcriptional regulator [Balneolaceae bacterium]